MNNRMAWKLILVLVSILLSSGLISSVLISVTTKSAFKDLVREADIAAARQIAQQLRIVYGRNESWQGINEILNTPGLAMVTGRMGPGMMNMGRRMPMGRQDEVPGEQPQEPVPQNSARQTPGPFNWLNSPHPAADHRPGPQLLLTNVEGDIIAHTMEKAPENLRGTDLLEQGIPVFYNRNVVGYVFLGSMIDPVLGPFQQAFLGNVYRVISISTLMAVILGAGAGFFFIRSVTEPLKALAQAAHGVSQGQYDPILPAGRRDEIGELSRSFLFMTRSLREADAWKKKIISDSAHELRTPVSVLQGNIEMMLDGVYPIDRQRVESLQEETNLLSRLVEELQTLARAEQSGAEYRFEATDVGQVLRHVYTTAAPLASAADIKLHLSLPERPLNLKADSQKLAQGLSNLIQNALRYTPRGGRVDLGAVADGSSLVLYVEDSGPGIPKEERDLVFERFYRLDRARGRQTGGSGLGLAIVREIALAHGGNAEAVDAEKLEGIRFVLRLPAMDAL